MLPDRRNLAEELVKKAMKRGADAAEVYIEESHQQVVDVRLERIERLQSAGELGLGLRVFKDGASALTSTRDLGPEALNVAIDGALELVAVMGADEYNGIVEPALHPTEDVALGLEDPGIAELSLDTKVDMLKRTEASGMGFDKRIQNSSGAFWRDVSGRVTMANSNGFVSSYAKTMASYGVSLIAEENDIKQTDGWYSCGVSMDRLDAPEDVGRIAGQRAARKLGARSLQTQRTTVVFDPRAGADLLKTFAGSASAAAIHRGSTFLVDKLGTQVANSSINILDNAALVGGIASRPFDGEGVASRALPVVENGILSSYLADGYYGRKLKCAPTGHGGRQFSSTPSIGPTNLILSAGSLSEEQLLKEVGEGFYVTRLYWVGVNPVTGDMSRGAEGLWISGGELVHAVQEVTLAGNLLDMLKGISLIANNQDWRMSIVSPSFAIPDIMVSGK